MNVCESLLSASMGFSAWSDLSLDAKQHVVCAATNEELPLFFSQFSRLLAFPYFIELYIFRLFFLYTPL